ncbi:S8 family serine peptidase [Helicobacter sp. XJK30-2]|uniref:S8 family serine peptidase n=1 Tax=Helicobacter zhangjianzhongii TaxID=2974574 RepID=A0ACC6FSC9_9HELI|nr:S8 family serine peptidase [Helicobacter sp. XJK30-2]MDL0082108.1 S8 family serine peptidase [Helicobacter sp. XJK30-2]
MKKYAIALCIGVLPLVLSASDQINKLKKSWQIINYDENSGFDGSGINLGIIDSVFNDSHRSLQGKDNVLINNDFDMGRNDRDGMRHGTHVAGIAIGKKLGENDPHGIAYNGRYYGLGKNNPGYTYTGNLYEDIKNWDVKIINNSWEAPNYYPLINVTTDYGYQLIQKDTSSINADYYFNTLLEHKLNRGKQHDTLHLIRISKEKDILNIWGAGNDGRISPSAAAVAASYDEELRAWLVVGALNADGIEVKEEGGKRELIIKSGMCSSGSYSYDCSASPAFSNAFKGAALYAITAPGVDIDSANAYFGKTDKLPGADQRPMCSGGEQEEFCGMSGTSQATPMVSGAAMLVQQKFGFLGGAQIADVLLTTANNDFKAPKLMLKYLGKGSLANIIYVGDEIPTTTDGKIDKDRVKQDLREIGYKDETFLNKILNNAINVNGSPEGIIKLSKEEVFGQGILDVQKALKGLARLDVNRMNKNSVEHFEGENQAFYTIDTKGLSGEFSNNIDQRLWEDKWHIDGAWNSPKEELKDIKKAGLIKVGAGKLTLSGTNTYEGATRVLQGVLELSKSGKLVHSNAYAESAGVLLLSGGVIEKNAYAKDSGIVHIENSATIKGTTYADNGGVIQLGSVINGTNTSGATLATSGVKLTNGGILAGSGTIATGSDIQVSTSKVENLGGIVMAGFGAAPITSLTQNTLTINGSYTQDSSAKLQIAFSGTLNSKLEATSYDIKGGTLEFVPIYSGEGSLLTAGKTIHLDLGSLKNHTDKFDTILPQSNNVLDFTYNHAEQTLSTALRADAFKPSGDSTMGETLKDIFQDPSLSKDYQDYFGAITNAASPLYQASLDSLAENAPLQAMQDTLTLQESLSINSLAFLADSAIASPAPLALRKLPRLAAVAGTNMLQTKLLADITSTLAGKKNEVALSTNYTHFKHSSYYSNAISTTIQAKRAMSSSLIIGGFLDFTNNQAKHTYTQASANSFSLGGSAMWDLKHISLISALGAGLGANATTRSIIAAPQSLQSSFMQYLLNAQIGVARDFAYKAVVFKPMALLNYSLVAQGSYAEQGGIFAKSYASATYNTLGSSLGLHIGYAKSLESISFSVNGFGFYTLRLLTNLQSQSSFSDFSHLWFSQNHQLSMHGFYGGLNAQINYKRYFARLGFSSQVGADYYSINANASVGLYF